ncbi:39S ribosomal protein L41, mitochondrial [Scaptodrosophila lebanonensis]|uniref:39S ribosomal protein L41, mitochondrial n=1 Tax=Drosophila lebanonensis TaxID=7225 RepID=A0A6J2U1Z7_DROLE|nr:39S ribosomal protein L41, mitochondrial [Scaptodrosophila lebanonensis]
MQNSLKFVHVALRCQQRSICTSAPLSGKRNFRKFNVYNKRGTRVVKEAQKTLANPPVAIHKRGVRDTGVVINGQFVEIPEKIPDIIVPDLSNCKLKPYVSYKAPEVVQSEFTSLDLFNAVYSKKIIEDFKADKLQADGEAIEPSPNEQLTPSEALIRARKTGSDIF